MEGLVSTVLGYVSRQVRLGQYVDSKQRSHTKQKRLKKLAKGKIKEAKRKQYRDKRKCKSQSHISHSRAESGFDFLRQI